mgnify:CR=1 FL=1
MGDLREQLLKAKLIDENQSRQARKEKRQKRKKVGAKVLAKQAEEKKKAYQEKLDKEALQSRQDALVKQVEQAEATRETRLAQIVETTRIQSGLSGSTKFYFIARSKVIPCLEIAASAADALRAGQLAIVEKPGSILEDFAVVPRDTARKLQEEAPELILFFNGS